MQIEEQIRAFLVQNWLYLEQRFPYDDNASFIDEGLIDSMGVMELVDYVQSKFHVPVAQDDINPDNFDSVAKMSAFVRCKLNLREKKHGCAG